VSRGARRASWIVVPLGVLFMTGLLLWSGIAIVVRCDRAPAGAPLDRVAATVDYRVLGVLTVRRVTLGDVERADWYEGGGRGVSGSGLMLVPREGQTWSSPRVRYAVGTRPKEAAARINAFIAGSPATSLRVWWASWLLNLLAIPFLLLDLVFLVAAVRWLLLTPGTGRAPGVAAS
jgi:hypothetical protein